MKENGPVKPLEVLLVEDAEDDVFMIEESLGDCGFIHIAHVASDGEEATQYLERQGPFDGAHRPDLVLLDINIPKKSGFEVLQEIKANTSLRTIPVVMLTTSSREEDIDRSYQEGAASFITKPMHFDRFRDVMQQFARYWATVTKLPHA